MPTESIRATAIVPTYDRPAQIARCVTALQAQTLPGLEIVVVDDGSPTAIERLPEGPHPVTLIRQANAGPAAARNRGAAEARGGWLLFTDDDCRPRPGWAAAFADAMPAAVTMLGGRTVNAVEGDIYAQVSQDMNDHLSALPGAPFFPSNNIAVPRDAFLALGGFDTGYRRAAGEDRALCRSWDAAGYAFAAAPGAVVDHHHALSARRFWRQHRNYGYGAARFHETAPRETTPSADGGPGIGFYVRLVAAPLRGGVTPSRIARAGLIAAAQVATAQGYAEYRREGRDG